jgi:hypothetical protein
LQTKSQLAEFEKSSVKERQGLTKKNHKFCMSFGKFLSSLLSEDIDPDEEVEDVIYHLGESHCLSYANKNVSVFGRKRKIKSRIIFGAKAFHLAQTSESKFSKLVELHFMDIPHKSIVFLSFGEIDCRSDEGFLLAASEKGEELTSLIEKTAHGYVQRFDSLNRFKQHKLFFF